jgi:hypothetical protein
VIVAQRFGHCYLRAHRGRSLVYVLLWRCGRFFVSLSAFLQLDVFFLARLVLILLLIDWLKTIGMRGRFTKSKGDLIISLLCTLERNGTGEEGVKKQSERSRQKRRQRSC